MTIALAERAGLALRNRFELLCRVRAARGVSSPVLRVGFARRRLLAVYAFANAVSTEHGASGPERGEVA